MRSNYNHRARLVLGEPQAVYYAGQELTGYIELEIQKPIQFSAINLTFHGDACTSWTETDVEEYNGIQQTREVEYKGGQECLHYTQCLYGTVLSGRGKGVIDIASLEPGEREIPFKFLLPSDIPSSYKSKWGRITYNVTAHLEYLDHSMGRDELYHEFQVVAPMNLLQDDIVRPLEMHFEEVYSCWCSSSPMSVDVKCPVSGYCPGQAIPITIKVRNQSAIEVKKIVFKLVKKELYRSQEPPSEYTIPEKVLSTIKTGALLSNSNKGLTCHLPVPPMIAPNMDNCDNIDIGFFLRATIKLTGCNDDLEDEVLLFIGMNPIPGTPGSENYVHPLATDLPNGAPVSDPPLRADIEQVARPNSNSYPGHGTPYPADIMNTRPVQTLNSPYPDQKTPYPTESPKSSYPSSPYPDQKTPYPTESPRSSYPGQKAPPYPVHASLEPHAPPKPIGFNASPYLVPDGYPNPIPPNPSSRSTSPYPTTNSPYPTTNSPYPTTSPPYPTTSPPYPASKSPDPETDSISKTSVHTESHPGTESISMTSMRTQSHPGSASINVSSLRTQTIGFMVSSGSPYPPAKNDDPNSPYTPLMQNYSPSAPPPST